MKSHTRSGVSLALVLTSAATLVSMIAMLKVDSIVHGDLYRYGLRFSYAWALPYWTLTTIVFAMGWFNIIISVAFQFYVLIYGRKEVVRTEASKEQESQPTKSEVAVTEATPIEKVEEPKEQATEPIEEKSEETPLAVETTSQQEQTETIQNEEVGEQKEQESKSAEESEGTETKETSTPSAETEPETPAEKSEEEPILIGVPKEESRAPQEVGS